jgi:hypothetical protein
MTEPERTTPAKRHESIAAVFIVALVAVIVTSPCWAFVLLVWVAR